MKKVKNWSWACAMWNFLQRWQRTQNVSNFQRREKRKARISSKCFLKLPFWAIFLAVNIDRSISHHTVTSWRKNINGQGTKLAHCSINQWISVFIIFFATRYCILFWLQLSSAPLLYVPILQAFFLLIWIDVMFDTECIVMFMFITTSTSASAFPLQSKWTWIPEITKCY